MIRVYEVKRDIQTEVRVDINIGVKDLPHIRQKVLLVVNGQENPVNHRVGRGLPKLELDFLKDGFHIKDEHRIGQAVGGK